MALIEEMFTSMIGQLIPEKRMLATPWPRFTYSEVMERFGKDNPDIRFGLELKDVTDLASGCGFQVFDRTVQGGGHVRGINVKGCGGYSRKDLDGLAEFAAKFGAKGLAYLAVGDDGRTSIILRQVPDPGAACRFAWPPGSRTGRPAAVRRRQTGGGIRVARAAARSSCRPAWPARVRTYWHSAG